MIRSEKETQYPKRFQERAMLSVLGSVIAVILTTIGLWYAFRQVSPSDLWQALLVAEPEYMILGLVTILATICLKTWRWQLLLPGNTKVRFKILFWAIMLGQYVNAILPFLRLGEVARIFSVGQQTGRGKVSTAGTIAVEKILDMAMLLITLILILPLLVITDLTQTPGQWSFMLAMAALAGILLVSYRSSSIINALNLLTQRLPPHWRTKVLSLFKSVLDGLTTMRNKKVLWGALGTSVVIAITSVLTPYFLFLAFHMKLGFLEAAVVHIAVTSASAPPSTPAKLGIFESAVIFVLNRVGLTNQAVILSYAVVFHLVVILPQLVLGSIATSRTNWKWLQTTWIANVSND